MKYAYIIFLSFLFFLPVSTIEAQGADPNLFTEGPCCLCSGPYGSACYELDNTYNTCSAVAQHNGIPPDNCYSSPCAPNQSGQNTCQPSSIQSNSPFNLQPIKIRLNTPIPGLEEFAQDQGVTVDNSTIAKYIGGVYKFFVGIAGILAVFMLAFGGVWWLFSGGNQENITKAKEIILGSIAGLILAVGSYTILYTINPRLVEFNQLSVTQVDPFVAAALNITPQGIAEAGATADGTCPSQSMVQSIVGKFNSNKIIIDSGCSDKRLLPSAINKLEAVENILTTNERIRITSAYRSLGLQQVLYNCYKNCTSNCGSCNEASAPSCNASHLKGVAADVCIEIRENNVWRTTCNKIRTQYNNGGGNTQLANDQRHLQEIMQQAGFHRYCGEWWHFESEPRPNSSTECSPGVY